MNLFVEFFKFFKCRLFDKIPENLKQIFVNNERSQKLIIEYNYLLFNDKS